MPPDSSELFHSLQKAAIKIKSLQLEIDNFKKTINEPIAVIGVSCRFPGGANDPQAFWELLKKGYDGITEVPSNRWDIDSFYDSNPGVPGKMYVRSGGFLNTPIDAFDAHFFGISPREAKCMDPQQRLLLEVAWEALENACINPFSLKGSKTGVFLALCTHDYADLGLESEENNIYLTTGNAGSVSAGRLSYLWGLQGPSMIVDTACSSSLVAIHSACKSLQTGESELALAGGVNIMLNPSVTIGFCDANILAKDGHCKTFDAAADGYIRSEGCGVVILKCLSNAVQDRDPILGVIRATEVNQDGASSGLTVPNKEAQVALIRNALAHAELEPNAIDYIEAHGTGTSLGDPIEVGALSTVFSGRKDHPLWIGTVKTNIGHLEAAAGIAGMIKTVLALNHEEIPPHLHFQRLNPHISLDSIPAKIPLNLTSWHRSSRPRIAGVSSFGFSGTNAHVIVEEPPVLEFNKNAIERPWHILTLSAKTQAALDQLVNLYTKQLPEEDLADIAFTANTGRAHFLYRATIIAQSKDELLQHLRAGDHSMGQASDKPPEITYMFTGQTVENSELMETSPVFIEAMERSKGLYEYALFELWKSWGFVPDYVAGEGTGDIIAAIAAKIITLEEGLRLISSNDNPEKQIKIAGEIDYCKPQIDFISSWTGQVISKDCLTADYWKPHENIRTIPEGTLVISTQSNWKDLLKTLAQLYLNGIQIDWKAFDKPYNRKKVSLPTYPFQRQKYWIDAFRTTKHAGLEAASWFYQISWIPKPIEKTEGQLENPWLIVSQKEELIEGLQTKTIKPEQAITEIVEKTPAGVLWVASGEDSLKQALEFVQAFSELEAKPSLYFITHGIQPVGPITDLVNASFNGFYKTIKLEMPTFDCRHIDLGPGEQLLAEELLAADHEGQVAYRQGIRFVPRLVHIQELKQTKELKINLEGSYLITGGMGGLGLKVAEWLVKQGAKHLVLGGRSASQRIEIPGAKIETVAVDISQRTAVDVLMQKFGNEWPELKGIIQAAGVLDDAILPSQDWSKFEKVFAPKVQGSWILHEASLTKPLDFFVLFSSVASTLGSPGQINYSSANAYIDALVFFRKEMGLPALAISWGPWAEVGLAAKLTERHRAGGLIAFKPDEGIKAFGLALAQNHPHVTVANVNWELVSSRQAFLSELIAAKSGEVPNLLQILADSLPSERKDLLNNYLQQTVGKILGLTSINPEVGFFEAGMDSLMTEELQEKLQADIGSLHKFPTTLAFDYPSVQKITQYFEEHIFPLIGIKAIVNKVTPATVTAESEPIAVIGLGCRFPGGATHPQAFWELLKQGFDGITEVPLDRWEIDSFYDPDPEAPGKMYVRRFGFLDGSIETFDANFFGISPREAEYMDPQQRLILEVAWEALENSCIDPISLNGSHTGVFIGVGAHDYNDLLSELGKRDEINIYLTTGNTSSILAGRLSYFLGLQGPCLALDTACSSSLVAIHFACKSLQSGACQLALAGGVNLILNPNIAISMCKGHMLAKDGYCKTFDADADGYVRGEGCGVVILKRFSDAIRDQDTILGVIRATEINQDGATSGLTVPNGEAQATLVRQALEQAKLEPDTIDYIEAHGTGTSLGDPIEVGALSNVFSGRKEFPLWISTVKTNIGHLEAGAGIAGFIKTVLALKNEAIPPHLHFNHLNPRITLDSIPAKIPLTLTPWQRSSRPRIAGISSFGFSGTNAHAIVEEPPVLEFKKNLVDRPYHLLTLSAKTLPALDQLVDFYIKQLPEEEIADIAFTANTGRAHFPHRITVLAQTRDELLQHLQTGEYLIGRAFDKPPKIIFIFTGQTIENSELIKTSPVFNEAMERSKGLYEYALFELWKSWGVVPDYVTGEGNSDAIAAIAAGMITIEEGIRLIEVRNNPAELDKVAKEIRYQEPQIGFISSWTGQVIRKEGLTPDYWKPHDIIRNIPEGALVISTQNSWKDLLQTLAQLYLNGIQIDWKAFDKPYNRKKVPLPTYPFQRERYWAETLKAHKKRILQPQAHPLLGELIPSPSKEKLFRNEIDLDFLSYLEDHKIFNTILFPGAGFLVLMQTAGDKLFQSQSFTINNLIIEQPLALEMKKQIPIELLANPKDGGYSVSIYSIEKQSWILHATGELSTSELSPGLKMEWEHMRSVCPKSIDIDALYSRFDALGLHYGKQFQTLRKIWTGNNEFIAELEGDASSALIDGSLQALATLSKDEGGQRSVYLPYSIDRVICLSELGTSIRIHGKLTEVTDTSTTAEIEIFSYDGKPLLKIEGFHTRKTDQNHLQQMLAKQAEIGAAAWFYQICWQPKPLDNIDEQLKSPWLIVSQEEIKIEGLQSKVVKHDPAVNDIVENPPAGILWYASGKDSLKYALELVQALGKLETKPSLYFITQGIQPVGPIIDLDNSTFNGFYKTLKLEMPTFDCRHIDLAPNEKVPLKELLALDQEGQVAYRQGVRYVARFLPTGKVKRSGKSLLIPIAKAYKLETSSKGSLENLYLKPEDNISTPAPHEISIEVKAAGLNFRDVLNAMGLYPGDPGPLGCECAGIVTAVGKDVVKFKVGDRVAGFGSGCFASNVVSSADFFNIIPSNLKFTEAAVIPIVFSTAYYGLIKLAQLKAGDRVLIHAAAGGVGLAAVEIAQQVGAEIYATAGSQDKQAYLRSLEVSHIYNSRTLDFAEEILRDTQGQGVDVILNSLTGEGFIAKTVSACHQNARFVEIGKRDIWSKEVMDKARSDIDYFILALDDLMVQQPQEVTPILKLVVEQFAKNKFKPLPYVTFTITDAERAFEYLQRAKNIGKVILTLPESKQLKIDPEGSYLITGAFGGLGQKVAEWLAKQGAKHLVLAGRKTTKKIEFPNAVAETIAIDISQRPSVDTLMQKFGTDWPPLKGIIHAAGVLDDGILSSQDWSRFENVFAPKVKGSWNLHEASLAKPLDFFVLFSSIASSIGSPSQINYSSANAYMDALASYRQEKGLPALSISWGPWAEVGMAAKLTEQHRAGGFIAFKPEDAIKAFELALTQIHPHVSIANIDWKLVHSEQTFLSEMTVTKTSEAPILLQRLTDALPSERKDILTDYLQRTVGKILGISSLNPELGFFDAGMDSLMAVELRNKLQADIGSTHVFTATLSFDYPSVLKLSQYFEEHIFPLIGIKAIIKKAKETVALVEIDQIAIIGLGCRFPGGANDPKAFWELLKQGYDGTIEIPKDRWDINSFYDPNPEAPGKMYIRRGGFLNIPVDMFDANFFGISPREAECMDPQQRLFLEVAWEALENACINPLSLNSSKTGVFVGLCTHDYADIMSSLEEINVYQSTGNAGSILAGRLSYFLGLQGPSVVVDTACSSSLYSIHSACKSLQNGESKLALAGGINILLNPAIMISFCQGHLLAKDGHCKTFDADADGYVRSEGCGIIVLKRLSDAIRDQDPIYGVIRATSINQDGATSGITVPNGEAQTALIQQALAYAELEPNAIDYIEAHGTGTSLGDPIEVGALSAVFKGRKDHPLWIGTVKTNIGHLEASSGVAGVIKTVLALNHEAIPPHLHFQHLNPHISLDSIPAQIPLTLTPWQRSNRPRIAGVSAFGVSGTNAHAIIEEPPLIKIKKNAIDRPWHILTLSAKTQPALDQLVELYTKQLPEEDLSDIAFTANTGRAHFIHRITAVAQTRDELLDHLQTGDYLISQAPLKPTKITFFFSGQIVDSTELMETSSVFKDAMERSHGLYEYALFELWKSWGIVPDYIAGEGIGDIIAAIAAQIITLEEGLKLIASKDNLDVQVKIAKAILYREPQIGFISSWTGQVIRKEGLTADYWIPHESVRNIPEGTLVISTQTTWKELLKTLAQLYLNGIQIDWKAFDQPYNRKKVSLPTYPFQRERYWIEALKIQKKRILPSQSHPLLGEFIASPSEEKLFRNEIDLDFLPYLKDHKVFDTILFPGAGFLELIHAAGTKLFQGETFTINNLVIEQPLAFDIKKPTLIELLAKPKDGGYSVSVYSIEKQSWILHAKSELSTSEPSPALKMEWDQLRSVCQKSIDIDALYSRFEAMGFHYGKQFQTLRKLWTGNNELIAELEGEASSALIDGCLQALAPLAKKEDGQDNSVFLPYSIDQISCYSKIGTSIRIHGKLMQVTEDSSIAEIEIFSCDGKPLMKIDGFHARRTNQNTLEQILAKQTGLGASSWFYQISWLPKPLEKTEQTLKSPWLIVSQEEEEIEGLQSKKIKPEQAVKEIVENPPAGILWFASGEDSLKYALELVQTLGKLEAKPSLYFITHGIQPVGPITDLENTTINGFYKTLKLEMPTLDSRHIDLGPNEKLPAEELLASDQEGQVAYRKGLRYVPRLLKSPPEPKQLKIDSKGSYLITGGFGGLGLKVAEWLVKQGAKHLVLVGRRTPQKIEIPNAAVKIVAMDISQRPAVDALMLKFGSEWPELKGIIHAAGVLDDGIIASQDWSRFEKVFEPKIQGSWNLHEASLTKPLDFYVLFSSIASSMGSPGQINYASANAYMDALAYFRQEKGLPALTISWGPWAEVGLAAKLTELHRAIGFTAFKPDEGIKAFELALTQTLPHISIGNVDWKLVPFRQTFLSELIAAKPAEEPILLQLLTDALPSERKEILTEYLQHTAGKILGISSLDPELGFFVAGMDSLMTEELYEKLQADMGSEYHLPNTIVFDYPTVNKLSDYIINLIPTDEENNIGYSKIESEKEAKEIEEKFVRIRSETVAKEVKNMSIEEIRQFLKKD